jgi:hypothetical protein
MERGRLVRALGLEEVLILWLLKAGEEGRLLRVGEVELLPCGHRKAMGVLAILLSKAQSMTIRVATSVCMYFHRHSSYTSFAHPPPPSMAPQPYK